MTITITSSTPVTNSATISQATAPVINTYTTGEVITFTNSGVLSDTSATNGPTNAGILLSIGHAPGGVASLTNSGTVSALSYGIKLSSQSGTSDLVTITNSGTIFATSTLGGQNQQDAGIFTGGSVSSNITNSGKIIGPSGIFLQSQSNGTVSITNTSTGTITATEASGPGNSTYGIKVQNASGGGSGFQGSATLVNAGLVNGFIDLAVGNATIVNAGTFTQGALVFGTGALIIDAGAKGGVSFADFNPDGTASTVVSTLTLAAGTAAVGTINIAAYTGFGAVTVANGADFAIGNASSASSFSGVSTIANFGTLNIAGALTNTTINMEGNVAGSGSQVDFTGTNTSTKLINYGGNDQIVITTLAPGSGTSYQDSYNTATGVLTINELNASGATIGTSNVTVSGTNPLSTASFVNVSGPGGDTIVLASSSLVNSGSIYIDFGEQVTLTPTATSDTDPVTFGTHGSVTGLNILDLNSNPGGQNRPLTGPISGFGLNDAIILGPSLISASPGDSFTYAYNAGSGEYDILDNTTGKAAAVFFSPASNYNAGSFVQLFGTNGLYIETPATVAEQSFTFSTSGTGNFDNPFDFTGGVAPGQNIYAGEVVSVVAGTASISATMPVTDNGTIIVTGSGSGLIDSAPLSGAGTIVIAGGGQVTLANTTGTDTGTVYFGTGGTSTNPNLLDLTVPGTAGFSGTIANFGTFDTIILGSSVLPSSTPGSVVTFSTMVSGGQETLTVTTSVNGTIHTDNITFASPPPGVLNVTQGPQGIVISDMPCFAAGTRILTPGAQVSVEALTVGDVVLTARDGAERQIIWVGQRTVDLARHAMPDKVRPVRILAGAFSDGLPERDVVLSPDHALFIDGHLIEAKTLVNGVTVRREDDVRYVTYHHIELAAHDVVLAEGLPAESYLDSGNRVMFESDSAPMMLHPDFAAASRATACAPLAVDGDVVMAARSRILARAVALGFATSSEIDLVVRADGVTLAPLTGKGTVMHFALPAGASRVELVSSTGVPAELTADPADRRVLGVAVSGLALIAGGSRREISLDDTAHEGFYAAEPTHRWTNGRAVIALPKVVGGTVLEISINGQAARWLARGAA